MVMKPVLVGENRQVSACIGYDLSSQGEDPLLWATHPVQKPAEEGVSFPTDFRDKRVCQECTYVGQERLSDVSPQIAAVLCRPHQSGITAIPLVYPESAKLVALYYGIDNEASMWIYEELTRDFVIILLQFDNH